MGSCLFSSPSPDTATPTSPEQIPTVISSSSSSSLKVCCHDWKKLRNWKKKKRSEDGATLYGRRSAIRSSSSSSVTGIGSGREIREEEVHRLPGRMFLNGASDVACLYTQQGKKGPNQDAMLVWEEQFYGFGVYYYRHEEHVCPRVFNVIKKELKSASPRIKTCIEVGQPFESKLVCKKSANILIKAHKCNYFHNSELKLKRVSRLECLMEDTRIHRNFASRRDTIFCGVFDGHGPYGHMVSKKVRDALPLKLCTQWRSTLSGQTSPCHSGSVHESIYSEENIGHDWGEYINVNENEKIPEMYVSLGQSLLKAFWLMDKELKLHTAIDCFCSGTTAVTVIKQGQDLVIANVGDSRAILGARDKNNNLVALQLTEDLKPNLPREAARIKQCRGRIFALQSEPEVARLWLPNNDSPGLAMARAFGDFCLKDYGLISAPDISYHRLSENDEFIVLATDGVWDALSNEEVLDIVASAPTCGTAARALVDCAVRSWHVKYPTSKVDDCAAVCLFLDPRSLPDDNSGNPKEPTNQVSLCASHQDESNQEVEGTSNWKRS